MVRARTIRWFAVGVVLAVVVASGPAVPVAVVDEPRDDGGSDRGARGTATVRIAEEPGPVRLERGRFGAGAYTFDGTAVVLAVEDVSGYPVITYELSIEALGFVAGRLYYLNASDAGSEVGLSVDEGHVPRGDLENDTYTAHLMVGLDGSTERVLYDRNLTVEVVE